ncbi:amidohydrolase family protein [Thalassoglobus sp. JC818]|uniref:N-acetylglucosamine-6-phosphate deacetylase n=1 Tax=Thalassoglobus sp. JC818 TaxID=3232136 RepID=UPI00345A7011
MQIIARDYRTAAPIEITINGEIIEKITAIDSTQALPFVAPGLFDLQINGYGGIWFSDENLTVEQVLKTLEQHFQHGITHLFPTLITNSQEALEHGFSVVRKACEQEQWADKMVLGCHLEGPYISSEDGPRGAHPIDHVRKCSWEEVDALQRASGDRIRLVTLAPESEGAAEFIRQTVNSNITISIGHTAATADQIAAAVEAGATLSTHLGNGAHGTLRRHPNYIWDQLGEKRLSASIISDGHHLPASVVRSIFYAKGLEKTILTCDASGLAGCPPGEYDYHGGRFEVLAEGPIVIAGQRQLLAGSGVQTDVCVAKMIEMTGCTLEQAWTMATTNPARVNGVKCASLTVGAQADLTLFDHSPETHELKINSTIAQGKRVFDSESAKN